MARSVQSTRPAACRIDVHPDGRIRRMDKAALALWGIDAAPARIQDLWHGGDATTLVPDERPIMARTESGPRPVAARVIAQGDGISVAVRDATDEARSEARIRHSERQLRDAQEMASVGSWEWDIRANQISWSDELYRQFGLDPETFEATYEAYMEHIHPDDVEIINKTVETAMADHQPWSFTHRIVRGDGEVRWVYGQGAVDIEDGQPVRMYGTEQDITDQRVAQEKEKVRRAWFEKSLDLLCVIDSSGRFIELNPAWSATLGYSMDELVGARLTDFVHADDRASTQEYMDRLWQGPGEVMTNGLQSRYVCKDGSTRILNWTSSADSDTGNLYGVARDITRELQEARRFEQLLESAPDGMIMVDRTGDMLLVNAQTERLFGYDRAELVGKPLEILIPDRFREAHEGHRGGFFAEPKSRPMGSGLELFAMRKDGSEFPVEISLSPIESDEGLIVTAAIRDISERKAGEKARRTAYKQQLEIEQLEKSNQARIQLLNTVAHELNTPLTPVQLQMRVLKRMCEKMDQSEAPTRSMIIIQRNLDRLSSLVQDILDAARMESGRLRIQPAPTSLAHVAEEAVEAFEDTAQRDGVRLHLDIVGDARLEADRNRLTQVMFNLLSNAMKFTPESGAVHVRIEGRDDAVHVSVDDDGIGISPEGIERLFQPFSQVHDGSQGGTGLGLYICKGIVEEHGGRIRVESPGKDLGSTFTFWIPRKQETATLI